MLKPGRAEVTALLRHCHKPTTARGTGAAEFLRTHSRASARHLGFCQLGVAENWEGKRVIISKKQAELVLETIAFDANMGPEHKCVYV